MNRNRDPARDRLFLAAALVFSGAHFSTFFDPDLPIYTDIRYFVYFAWRMAHGAIPHLELFDNKTFGSHFVAALFHRAGEGLGFDGLSAIRACCLAVLSIGGAAIFAVFRRIGGGSQVVGFIGLLAYLGFGFIGALTAIGNFPKLFMPLLAPIAALLVLRRSWFWAGAMGGLAFLDWQVGALVGVFAALAALRDARGGVRAAAIVVGGGLVALLPIAIYYFLNDALEVTFHQTILASISRAEEGLANHTPLTRVLKMWRLATRYCPEQRFLFVSALAGLALVPFWWWRQRDTPAGRLVFPLAAYHYGILAFSLIDFQRYGDFFLVLQSLAFFLAMTWFVLYLAAGEILNRFGSPAKGTGQRRLLAGTAIALALIAARPAWLRPEISIEAGPISVRTRLPDQQDVARQVAALTRDQGKKLVLLGSSELLYLMRYENPLPLVYFNRPALSVYGLPGESEREAVGRGALSVNPDAVILPARRKFQPGERLAGSSTAQLPGFRGEIIASPHGGYGTILYSRIDDPPRTGDPVTRP